MVEKVEILNQKWEDETISFTLEFIISNTCNKSDFEMVFINDIAGDQLEFPVEAKFSTKKIKNQTKVTVQCDYPLIKSTNLSFDKITNFSAFKIVNKKIDLELNIPAYCGSENGKDIVVEIYNPQ